METQAYCPRGPDEKQNSERGQSLAAQLMVLTPLANSPDARAGRRGVGCQEAFLLTFCMLFVLKCLWGRLLACACSLALGRFDPVTLLDPLAYGVRIVERDAGALRQVEGTLVYPAGATTQASTHR